VILDYFFQTHHTSGWTLNAKHAGRPINNLTYSRVNHAEIIANSEREMKKQAWKNGLLRTAVGQ